MNDLPITKKRGRPRRHPVEHGRRPSVKLRLRQELYDEIAQRAQINGRSLSEEMERHIEEAFARPHASLKAAIHEVLDERREGRSDKIGATDAASAHLALAH